MADGNNFRNKSVSASHFTMVPRSDVPRSTFLMDHTHKTTFDAGLVIPVYLQEILPGDHFSVNMTAFARMSTPLFPVMDNFHLDSFFFFVPNRLVWSNWKRFMGERPSPEDSIDFTVPQSRFNAGLGAAPGSLWDYFGIPTTGQVDPGSEQYSFNGLPYRGYKMIWNEWFRDQNLQTRLSNSFGDGPDAVGNTFAPLPRNKRHDYFTSALPWPQKGDAVTLPLSGNAPVVGIGLSNSAMTSGPKTVYETMSGSAGFPGSESYANWSTNSTSPTQQIVVEQALGVPRIFADLSQATASTINAIRQAFQVQRLLERDARGGTRYTELLLSHFGVQPQDSRLQRPEYLGGGSTPININPIAQTSATGISGGASPLGSLGGIGTSVARHGFNSSFTEHGYVIGVVSVRADLTYQQGLQRHWSRKTRYDYYWPAFAHLGEQAILRKEIFSTGDPANDDVVFGYQERWAEYRYNPSQITGMFRSTTTGNIDEWHAAQQFASAPTLGDTFIRESPPMARILAAGSQANGQQFLFDSVFSVKATRPLPTYSVPGFIDRF